MKLLAALFTVAAAQKVATVTSFTKYPGYGGSLGVTGTVDIYADTAPTYNFQFSLSGAEQDLNVSVHIHAGVDCSDPALVGGHFWAPFDVLDPWKTGTSLPTDSLGNVAGSFNISFGYNASAFIRHALVIHDSASVRVACGIIHDENDTPFLAPHKSASLITYPGYTPGLNANGTVEVWDNGNGLQVNYRLQGLRPNSTGGLHIHAGRQCQTSGPHFWMPLAVADPWNAASATYLSNPGGIAEGSFWIMSGINLAGSVNHAVVVHDSAAQGATRLACGPLGGAGPGYGPESARADNFAKYPGYNGPLNVTGSFSVKTWSPADNLFLFDLSLSGATPNSNVSVHIHAGVTCDEAAGVGGHLWKPFTDSDPWNQAAVTTINTDASGNVTKSFELDFGYPLGATMGHAVVIHDGAFANRPRVACALIKDGSNNVPTVSTAYLSTYPNYTGPYTVTGRVSVYDNPSGPGLVFNYLLNGVPSSAMGGAHIHVGTTCENAQGHYFLGAGPDPWVQNWTSTGSLAEGAILVDNGYTMAQNDGHAVVIHDTANNKISCGILGATWSPTPAPTSAPCPDNVTDVFVGCRVYDFRGTCSETCNGVISAMLASSQNMSITVDQRAACFVAANASAGWINGDLTTLLERLNSTDVTVDTVCPPAEPEPDGVGFAAPAFATLALLFLTA